MERMRIALGSLVLLMLGACGGKHAGLSLSDRVYLECSSGLVSELERAADHYDAFASWVRTNSVADAQLAEHVDPTSRVGNAASTLPYGWSHEARMPASLQLYGRVLFCQSVRLGSESPYGGVLQLLAAESTERFAETWSADEAAHAIRSLAMIAGQIRAQPLIQ